MPEHILLLGSSIVAKWPAPQGLVVVNKGISGLLARDLDEYAARVLAYRGSPRTVLIYCGGNDVRAGTDPKEVSDHITRFVGAATKKWPAAAVVILEVLLSPSVRARPAYLRAARSINRGLRLYVSKRPAVELIAFSSENYTRDGTHLTADGYRELNSRVFST
jgi:lysophospholipase L1-like esterase